MLTSCRVRVRPRRQFFWNAAGFAAAMVDSQFNLPWCAINHRQNAAGCIEQSTTASFQCGSTCSEVSTAAWLPPLAPTSAGIADSTCKTPS